MRTQGLFMGDFHTVLVRQASKFKKLDVYTHLLPSCVPLWLFSASALRRKRD